MASAGGIWRQLGQLQESRRSCDLPPDPSVTCKAWELRFCSLSRLRPAWDSRISGGFQLGDLALPGGHDLPIGELPALQFVHLRLAADLTGLLAPRHDRVDRPDRKSK